MRQYNGLGLFTMPQGLTGSKVHDVKAAVQQYRGAVQGVIQEVGCKSLKVVQEAVQPSVPPALGSASDSHNVQAAGQLYNRVQYNSQCSTGGH
jgi:hypothetical protein